MSRKTYVYKSFPGLRAALVQLPHEAVLDGEILCLDGDARPQFDRLFYGHDERYFYAFDVSDLDGRDLRHLPLIERKRILRRVVPRWYSRLLYVNHIQGCGIDLFREVCRCDLEGVVAKWKHRTYLSGDVTSWVKIRNPSYSQSVDRGERFQRKPQSRVYAA